MLAHIHGALRLPLIDTVEEFLYDARLTWTMPNTIDERIIILDLDERSIAEQGHWPWQRDKLAELTNILFDEYEIRVLAWDMLFAETEEATAVQLIEQTKQVHRVETLGPDIDVLQDQY